MTGKLSALNGMDLSEAQLHSFIIKIWVDDPAEKGDLSNWSGQIRHVPGGEHRYIKNSDEISEFIRSCLPLQNNIRGPRGVWRWLKRLGLKSRSGPTISNDELL